MNMFILKLSFINLKRRKSKNIINILMMSVIIFLLSICIEMSQIFNLYIDRYLKESGSIINDIVMFNNINKIFNILFILIIIISIISIIVTINNFVSDRINEIVLYKSIGYKNTHLFQLLFFENIMILSISYIVSIILSNLFIYIIIFVFKRYLYINIMYSIYTILSCDLIILIIVCFMCFFISIFMINKVRKLSIKSLID